MGQLFTFQGVGQAEISDRMPKLKDGFVGVVAIKRLEVKRTRNAGDKLFIEFDVVESNDPRIHPVGTRYSWGVSLLDTKIANGNIKRWCAAVAGVKVADEQVMAGVEANMDAWMNQAVQQPDNNVFVNRYARVETHATTTGNNRPFMVHEWSPY